MKTRNILMLPSRGLDLVAEGLNYLSNYFEDDQVVPVYQRSLNNSHFSVAKIFSQTLWKIPDDKVDYFLHKSKLNFKNLFLQSSHQHPDFCLRHSITGFDGAQSILASAGVMGCFILEMGIEALAHPIRTYKEYKLLRGRK